MAQRRYRKGASEPEETHIVAGILSDRCISSTMRSLTYESYEVIVVEDC
jgi:nicotinamidase-related amidase